MEVQAVDTLHPGLTRSELARILELATRTGSAANMQPWRFEWDGEALRVHVDPTLEPSSVNHRRLATIMTFGGLLEHLEIAATVVGQVASAEVDLSGAPGRPWATLRFRRGDGPVDPLASAARTRFTDRRAYIGGAVSDPVFAKLQAGAADYAGCRLHLTASVPDELLAYIADAEKFFSSHKPIHLQVIAAVRWSDAELEATRDGLPWKAMGVGWLESRVLKLSRFWPVQALFNRIGYLRLIEQGLRASIASAAGLGLITVRTVSDEQVLTASRFAARAWLELHAAGYGKQPYLAPSLFAYESLSGALPADWPPEIRRRFADGLDILRRTFALPPDEIPLWLFRAGKSPGPLPADWYTLRRPLERVLRVLPAAGRGA